MTRSAMLRSQGGSKPGGPTQDREPLVGKKAARDLPPDATLPATPAQMLALSDQTGQADTPPASEPPTPSPRKASAPKRVAAPAPATPESPLPIESPVAVEGRASAGAPAATRAAAAAASTESPAVAAGAGAATPSAQETLDLVLRELRFLRELQERILQLLERSPAAERDSSDEDDAEVSPIRVRRRKSVVLIDDDPVTREAAVAEMTQADIPVRAFPDGNAAVSAIAAEKPDVIVLELAIAGAMEGRDVINMIKATMEWVDIPIVLWTRAPVGSQREARQIHGADEIVEKASGTPALVARVITLFRRR